MASPVEQASSLSQQAVSQDSQGNLREAIELYAQTVECFITAVKVESNPERKKKMEDKMLQYLDRAEELKKEVSARTPPPSTLSNSNPLVQSSVPIYQNPASSSSQTIPTTTTTTTTSTGDFSSTAMHTAINIGMKINEIDNDYKVSATVKDMAQVGYQKALQLNKEYKIDQKVATAASTAYQKGKEIDQTYQIHQKAGDAIKTGVNKAVEIEREYQIHQKIGQAVKTGINKAIEIDRQYEVHRTVANAVKSAVKTSVDLEREYQVRQHLGEMMKSGFNTVNELFGDNNSKPPK